MKSYTYSVEGTYHTQNKSTHLNQSKQRFHLNHVIVMNVTDYYIYNIESHNVKMISKTLKYCDD